MVEMVYTREKKNQQKRQLNPLDETSNDYIIGNSVNVNLLESENLEQLTNGQSNDFKRADKSVRQNQGTDKKIDNQFTTAVFSG